MIVLRLISLVSCLSLTSTSIPTTGSTASKRTATTPTIGNHVDQSDVNQYMQDSIASFQAQLHKSAIQKRTRVRRTVTLDDFLNEAPPVFESQIDEIIPFQSVPTTHPVELEPFQLDNKHYLAVVNFKNEQNAYNTKSAIYVYNYTESKFEMLQEFQTSGGIDFEFAEAGNEKYAIFLDHVGQNWYGGDSQTYEKWFQINQFLPEANQKQPFQYRTKVRALGAKKVKVLIREDKYPYFITANSYYETGNQYHVKSTMHFQTPYGYELVQSFETQGAQDVEVFKMDGLWYVVFANHQDNSGKVDIYSYIYKEQLGVYRNPFKLYQRISTHGARDFEYFTFDGNHYLVVANEYTVLRSMDINTGGFQRIKMYDIDSVLYWWTGKMFVEWQRIPTQGAVRWSYFTSNTNHPMLVVSNTKSQAVIYTFDPLRGLFKPTHVQGLSPVINTTDLVPDVRSVMAFNLANKTYLAVANYDSQYKNGTNIFELKFTEIPVPKLAASIPEIISTLLTKMKNELKEVKERAIAALNHVSASSGSGSRGIMTKSTDQNITVKIAFDSISITDTLKTSNLLYKNNVTINPVEELAKQAIKLKESIEQQRAKLVSIQADLADAVKVNEDAKISAKKTFSSDLTVTKNLTTNSLVVNQLLNNENITELDTRIFKKSKDQIITGKYVFTKNVTMKKQLNVDGLINNVNTSKIFLTTTDQTLTGYKTFTNDTIILNDIILSNKTTVNGLNVPDDIITRNDSNTIFSEKTFQNEFTVNSSVYVNGLIDTVNLTDFNTSRLTLSTDQDVSGKMRFQSGFDVSSDITVDGLIDGVNLTNLQAKIDSNSGSQNISGSKTFRSIRIMGSAYISKLNGYNTSEFVRLNEDQEITANWTFANITHIQGNLTSSSTINGLNLSADVVTLSGDQTINGFKIFNEQVEFNSDIIIDKTLNGVNLTSWKDQAVLSTFEGKITGEKSFINGVNITNNLNTGSLNYKNFTIRNPTENLISLSKNDTWPSNIIFREVAANSITVAGMINGVNIPRDLVTLSGNETIKGKKNFIGVTNINGKLDVKGLLNSKNVTEVVSRALLKSNNSTLSGNITFEKDVYFKDDVTLDGTLNNVSIPDDVITLNTFQNISGQLYFIQNTTFEGILNTGDVNVTTTVNNIDISKLADEAFYKDRNQTINSNLMFIGGIDSKRNLSVAGLINGVNLTQLFNSTVRLSKDQQVSGNKVFQQDTYFESPITTPGTINGINLKEFNTSILRADGIVEFPDNFTINGTTYINKVTTSNTTLLNNVNLKYFLENSAKRSTNSNIINGKLTFTENLEVTNITTSTVNNIPVNQIFTTNSNQTITGTSEFTSVILEDLNMEGLLNNVDVKSLNVNTLKKEGAQSITGKYTFQNDVIVEGNTDVNGYINGVNLTDYNNKAVKLNSDEIISGIKSFTNITFGNVTFASFLNNINMSLLFSDALVKNKDQIVCQSKSFTDNMNIGNGSFENVILSGLLNGVDIKNLDDVAVKLNENQLLNGSYNFTDTLVVENNLTVQGNINDRDINEDFMLTNNDQTISGYKTYMGKITGNQVYVTGKVDTINDIQDVYKKRFSLSANQTITSTIKFNDVIMQKEMQFPNNSTISNIDISEELIDASSNSVINGLKRFDVATIRGNLSTETGIVNNVNLTYINENALLKSGRGVQYMKFNQIFQKNLTIDGHLRVDGLINGMNVSDVSWVQDDINSALKDGFTSLIVRAKVISNATAQLMSITKVKNILRGVEKTEVITLTSTLGKVELGAMHSLIYNQEVYISIARALNSGCGHAYVLKCTLAMECELLQKILTNAEKLEFYKHDVGNGTLVDAIYVSHWPLGTNSTTGCPEIPEIYTWSGLLQKFYPYQSLNSDLMQSSNAPFTKSKSLLSLSIPYGQWIKLERTNSNLGVTNENEDDENEVFSNFGQSKKNSEVETFQSNNAKDYVIVNGGNYVEVLELTGNTTSSLKKQQQIKTNNGKHLSVGRINDGKVILTVSSGKYKESMKLYKLNEKTKKFEFTQKLPNSAQSVKISDIEDRSYLVYASPSEGVGLCEWQGIAGFQGCETVRVTDTESVETIITKNGAYTVAVKDNQIIAYKAVFEGQDESQ